MMMVASGTGSWPVPSMSVPCCRTMVSAASGSVSGKNAVQRLNSSRFVHIVSVIVSRGEREGSCGGRSGGLPRQAPSSLLKIKQKFLVLFTTLYLLVCIFLIIFGLPPNRKGADPAGGICGLG